VSAERAELCVVVMKQLQSPPSTLPQVMLSLAHSFSATVQTPWWSAWRQVPYRSRFRRLQRPEQHSPPSLQRVPSALHPPWAVTRSVPARPSAAPVVVSRAPRAARRLVARNRVRARRMNDEASSTRSTGHEKRTIGSIVQSVRSVARANDLPASRTAGGGGSLPVPARQAGSAGK
jgi:hypothetical protein